jgi:hypothetical protein
MGPSLSETVAIPSLTGPGGITEYAATILRPADTTTYPGVRPVALLQHGAGGNQCAQWWSAQHLAGHGYIALIWRSPPGANTTEGFRNAVDAMRSALVFVRSSANPFGEFTDANRIGLLGHSLGSVVVSFVQQDGDPGVRAIAALDTLRRWINGDPGGAVNECATAAVGEITPRVPALGFAMDAPCNSLPNVTPPDLKLAGYDRWREAGVPVMELVMAGYNHLAFASPGSEQQHRELAHFIQAWFDRWVLGDEPAEDLLVADAVLGRPMHDLLSTRFLSGAYLPGLAIDSRDYAAFLADDKAPSTRRRGGPDPRINRNEARRGVTFRFKADDRTASFECRLDAGNWKSCESPHRVGGQKLTPGAHAFRARATDTRGNRERKPALWRFAVGD